MAVAAYRAWQQAGKPVWPAKPIEDYVTRLRELFPKAAQSFSWYANEAHYTAVPAEDHTPFSQTGWPSASPEWYVFATDVMHNPGAGVDCNVLFRYWLDEARSGRTPWVKYLIWQAKLFDVRYNWRPQPNTGHYDHIHISCRTDYVSRGLGSWSIVYVPPKPKLMEDETVLIPVWSNGTLWMTEAGRRWRVLDPKDADNYKAAFAARNIPWQDFQATDARLPSYGEEVGKPVIVNVDAAVAQAAHDGAEAGAKEALDDGLTVTSTVKAAE